MDEAKVVDGVCIGTVFWGMDGCWGWFFDTLEVCPAILRLDNSSYEL